MCQGRVIDLDTLGGAGAVGGTKLGEVGKVSVVFSSVGLLQSATAEKEEEGGRGEVVYIVHRLDCGKTCRFWVFASSS